MFQLIDPSSVQKQTVLVHSVIGHIMLCV